jgi:hypothetical protein
VIFRVLIGTNEYIHDSIRQPLPDCEQQIQKLFCFSFANHFLLLLMRTISLELLMG